MRKLRAQLEVIARAAAAFTTLLDNDIIRVTPESLIDLIGSPPALRWACRSPPGGQVTGRDCNEYP